MPLHDSSLTAVYAETGPRLRAQNAAITLRMWHHLTSDEARILLFEPFRIEGRPHALIDAILIAAVSPGTVFALQLNALQVRRGQQALGDAFAAAVGDLLGAADHDRVIPAWRSVLDHMLNRIAERIERRSA